MIDYFIVACILLTVMIFLCLYRAYVGPTAADRVVAINIVTTKIVVTIALVAYVYDNVFFLDVALVYTLIGFTATIGVAKYLEKGALE